MKYTFYEDKYYEGYKKLVLLLWPDIELEEIDMLINEHKTTKDRIILVLNDNNPIGFINSSVRTDYVEGQDEGPVGYIEGIFVLKEYRKQNIAKTLVEEAIKYFKTLNIKEIASDSEMDNEASYHFHKAIGFPEPTLIRHYIKKIK